MSKQFSNRPMADCHPAPFKGSMVSGMQVYLVGLMVLAVFAVTIGSIWFQ